MSIKEMPLFRVAKLAEAQTNGIFDLSKYCITRDERARSHK